MSGWDRDAIDLVKPGFIKFAKDGTGEFGFIAMARASSEPDVTANAALTVSALAALTASMAPTCVFSAAAVPA